MRRCPPISDPVGCAVRLFRRHNFYMNIERSALFITVHWREFENISFAVRMIGLERDGPDGAMSAARLRPAAAKEPF